MEKQIFEHLPSKLTLKVLLFLTFTSARWLLNQNIIVFSSSSEFTAWHWTLKMQKKFSGPTDFASLSFSTWKWAEGHIPRISKTLLNTFLFTRWADCLSASSAGNMRPAEYVRHLPCSSTAVSTWNQLAKEFFKFQPMNAWIHDTHMKPSSTGGHLLQQEQFD